jgi:hypothetical protein
MIRLYYASILPLFRLYKLKQPITICATLPLQDLICGLAHAVHIRDHIQLLRCVRCGAIACGSGSARWQERGGEEQVRSNSCAKDRMHCGVLVPALFCLEPCCAVLGHAVRCKVLCCPVAVMCCGVVLGGVGWCCVVCRAGLRRALALRHVWCVRACSCM